MLKNCTLLILLTLLVFSCTEQKSNNAFSFEQGNFISYLEDKKDSSFFYRVDNLQIETYKGKVDTFEIEWKNKFEFQLKKQKPKTKLDSTPFIVKITKIKDNSYEFQAHYKNSKFKQKGSTVKRAPTKSNGFKN